MPPFRSTARALPLCALALLSACSDWGEPSVQPALPLSECRLPKLASPARCGTLSVPENRSNPGGRNIDIFVAVLPANTANPRSDPLLLLAGGPGQAASRLAPLALRFGEIRRTRDIVLVDQRGTGRSSPLECAAFAPSDEAQAALETDPLPKARECVAELQSKGVDLTQYTTAAWIDDLEAVRAALGYPALDLWGGSYGTRVALAYLARHPGHVRSMVLDGVAPPELVLPIEVWRTRERALDAVFDACEASAACKRAHPDLRASLDRISATLGEDGEAVEVADPRTGEQRALTLTRDAVLAGLATLAYVPELAALLPVIVDAAANGEYAPLFATARYVGGEIAEQFNAALHYSVTCSEDARRITAEDRKRLETLRTRRLAENVLAVCDVWPQAAAAPATATTPRSDVPVLLLSGGLDPVTPPEYAASLAPKLPRSRHIVASGYGHIVSPHGCAPSLVAAFVASAGFDRLPEACVRHLQQSRRPPLWASRFAPSP